MLHLLGNLSGLAAQASTVSGALGRLRRSKEFDRIAPRPAAGAGRPAVYAGRAHRENKASILSRIAA